MAHSTSDVSLLAVEERHHMHSTPPAASSWARVGNTCAALITSMRPAMWLKPLFLMLVAGAYATHNIPDLARLLVGFLLVGPGLWGGLYMLNAVLDADDDRRHPVKRYRPFAAGRVSRRLGLWTSVTLVVSSLLLSLTQGGLFSICAVLMCAKQLAYSMRPLRLKRFAGWDLLSGSLFNSTLRFAAGWTLFAPIYTMPLLPLVFAESLQLAGFLVNRMFTNYGIEFESQLGYRSTTARVPQKWMEVSIIACWVVGIAAFMFLCLNSVWHFHSVLLGELPLQAFLFLALLVAALPLFGRAIKHAQHFTPRQAALYYDLPLVWVFLISVVLVYIIKCFG